MMMALGMFVFGLPTLAYQELQRQTEWKHPGSPRVGTRDAYQYTGKGDDTITLTGWVAPELTGSLYSLDALRLMADTGQSWILIQGTGRIVGTFVITSITEERSMFTQGGDAGRVGFTIALKRTDASVLGLLHTLGDLGSIRNMLSLEGMSKMGMEVIDSGASALNHVVGSVQEGF